jgi:hypothetical protein
MYRFILQSVRTTDGDVPLHTPVATLLTEAGGLLNTLFSTNLAYIEIYQLAFDITKEMQYIDKELVISNSRRKAVTTWLHVNGHITIKRNGKVLPISA